MAHLDLIDLNSVALQFVETIREPVYDTPRLTRRTGRRTAQGRKRPDKEYRRRQGALELNGELSRYYQLAANQGAWKCPELLSNGKHDRGHSVS